MTLIVVVPTKEGIVMASDGQLTAGMIRSYGRKIKKLNDRCLWSAAGELALIQRVEENINMLTLNKSLPELRDELTQIVKKCVTELLNLDFRTPFFQQDPNRLLQLHPGDFVFAEYLNEPYILHITVNGTPEWIRNRFFATGSGAPFAYALLGKYLTHELDLERASVLAYKVIEEAIEVGAYGLGFPIDIWHISASGVINLEQKRLAMIEDTVKTLREMEVELLISKMKTNEPHS